MKIEAVMTPGPVTCHPSDSINDAVRKMWENDVGALPVVDDDGRLCGMITDRDACMAAFLRGQPLAALDVGGAMALDPICATLDMSLVDLEHRMQRHQIRRMPIVDDERRPIGIVSINDLAQHSSEGLGSSVSEHEVAMTLRAICSHRGLPVPRPSAAIVLAFG